MTELIDLGRGADEDPFAPYRAAARVGPMARVKAPLLGTHWMVTRAEGCQAGLKDQGLFVRAPVSVGRSNAIALLDWAPRAIRALTQSMLTRDGEAHRRLRSLVDQAFAKRSVEALRPEAAAAARSLLDGIEGRLADGGVEDLVRAYARPFPLTIIAELMGVAGAERARFARWADALTPSGSLWSVLSALPNLFQLTAWLRREFAARRADPRAGLITDLVAAEAEGDRLTAAELEATVVLLLFAGHVTTTHLISAGVWRLLEDAEGPALRRRLAEEPGFAARFVDALLWRFPPIQLTVALSAQDQTFEGARLARGETVLFGLAAALSDPERPEPVSAPLDPDAPRPAGLLAFGAGPHFCLGRALALLEAEIALTQFAERAAAMRLDFGDGGPRWSGKTGAKGIAALPVRRA
ncbi:MAG: cytochrome P450 [Pseudomonadota bacterium]